MSNLILDILNKKDRGSLWGRWDLHFHTPSSYDYKDKSVTNQQLIDGLINEGIKVVAITDHHIIDVDRIKALKSIAGDRITIFPGIELCAESRGSDPIHFIGIFSEDADLDYIWGEIKSKAEISSQKQSGRAENAIYCDLKVVSKLVKELGGIVTIHAGSKSNSIEIITNSLPVKMAQKKDLAEKVDIFELGKFEDKKEYEEKVFPQISRVIPMVIGSDNHNIHDYKFKELCWIKAKPTFSGLKQIILEPETRVFIGDSPEILDNLKSNSVKYIKELAIHYIDGYDEKNGVWFKDIEIPLNPELNVVIGNKGSGKSSISDTMGMLGDTDNSKDFSFLTSKKFLRKGYAENFEGSLNWFAKEKDTTRLLNATVDTNSFPQVKYLPQSYFENLCNDLESSNFENELQSVIFKHLNQEDRLQAKNFRQLVEFKTKTISEEVSKALDDLHQKNLVIFNLEEKVHQNNQSKLNNQLALINKEIEAHRQTKPEFVENPAELEGTEESEQKLQNQIDEIDAKILEISGKVEAAQRRKNELVTERVKLSHLESAISQVEKTITATLEEYKEIIGRIGGEGQLISLNYEVSKVNSYKATVNKEIMEVELLLIANKEEIVEKNLVNTLGKTVDELIKNSLVVQQNKLSLEKSELTAALSLPYKKYEKYKQKLKTWNERLIELEGTEEDTKAGTKIAVESEINYLKTEANKELLRLRSERKQLSKSIYELRHKIIDVFDDLKSAISKIISGNEKLLKHYNIEVVASFRYELGFLKKILDSIKKNITGAFYQDGDGKKVSNIFKELDLNEFDSINSANEEFISKLEATIEGNPPNHIHDQLKNPVEIYDYLFGFKNLEERYELMLNGKPLEILSPGERGALLLVFYLMIDEEEIPLIIDQPEDNLDNKSVFEILVHFIRQAKTKRQIILVTHNPNLAVGADAENVVYVDINKAQNNIFSFTNGAIEDRNINAKLVEVLEGTMPAFNLRKLKYIYE